MKHFIIITTINDKTEGIRKFERMPDYKLIIVGDKKTPEYEDNENLAYLSVDLQDREFRNLARALPYNHYTRKNIGYLYALKHGADVIYDTDDDNLPYDYWGFDPFECSNMLGSDRQYVNIYKYFTDHHIWPRGLPLDEVLAKNKLDKDITEPARIGVWQGLADNDPDVDAIYRLTNGVPINFEMKPPIALPLGIYAPFNSQNTLWRRELAALMYLPAYVSFRLTDILRGYIAQVIMHHHGFHLGFTGASVYQERNDHDLIKDFKDEIDCYVNIKPIVNLLEDVGYSDDVNDNLMSAYIRLVKEQFVPERELASVDVWLNEIMKIG